jgi:hypothetical protein
MSEPLEEVNLLGTYSFLNVQVADCAWVMRLSEMGEVSQPDKC